MEVQSTMPVLVPTFSSVCAYLVFLTGRSNFLRKFFYLTASISQFLVSLLMIPGILRGEVYVSKSIPFLPGLGLFYRVDALGLFFIIIISFLWIITSIYSLEYMKPEEHLNRFFGFFALCVAASAGITFAGNLITLFFVYEALTVCSYPLVVHKGTPEALKAGRKYLIYAFMGGTSILLAIGITYHLTGTTALDKLGILTLSQGRVILYLLFTLYIMGFGVKAVIMPLHSWLPSAMSAPTPISAMFHGASIVNVGAFGILRVIYNVFGVELMKELGLGPVLAYLASFTIIAGSIIALLQDNLKKRLAYSTISQVSYTILGAALLTPAAAIGGIINVASQAFQKITMFFVAGIIEKRTGKQNISELAGIGYQLPIAMGGFTIAALGFIGVPLLAGFISKWYLFLGAFQAHQLIFVGVFLIGSLLNAAYWLPIIFQAYFKGSPQKRVEKNEAHWALLYPIILTASGVLVLGVLAEMPGLPLSVARVVVQNVFGNR